MASAGLTRRHALVFAMSAMAVGPAFAPSGSLAAQSLAPPKGSFALTRRLTRGLRDGNSIVVTRTWIVAFAPQSRGIAVSGTQTAVSVEAPPKLAPLTKIEEDRSTEGMFPILLAPDGTIVAAGENTSQASFEASIRTAQSLLEESGFSEARARQQVVYMAQLQRAGSSLLDELPGDLFYPSTEPFRDVRQVALPDGASGEFELRWEASVQSGTALLDRARREVITRIGESERKSSEDWSLKAL